MTSTEQLQQKITELKGDLLEARGVILCRRRDAHSL